MLHIHLFSWVWLYYTGSKTPPHLYAIIILVRSVFEDQLAVRLFSLSKNLPPPKSVACHLPLYELRGLAALRTCRYVRRLYTMCLVRLDCCLSECTTSPCRSDNII